MPEEEGSAAGPFSRANGSEQNEKVLGVIMPSSSSWPGAGSACLSIVLHKSNDAYMKKYENSRLQFRSLFFLKTIGKKMILDYP